MRIGDVGSLVRAHEAAGNGVMLWSGPGIGKSSIVRQLCVEDGIECVDIRLSLLNPVDLRGIPVVKDDKVIWVPPTFFKKSEKVRFFFDEINLAPPTTQAAAYQLILDKQIGELKLDTTFDEKLQRPNHTIIAAGNRASDQAFAHQMPAPLRNRMAHIEVETNFDDWRDWAYKNGVDRVIVNFLAFTARVGVGINEGNPNGLLYFFDPKQHTTGSFPTPRSWEQVSRFLGRAPKFAKNPEALAGMLGAAVAQKFVAFVKVHDQLPNAEDVLKGKPNIAPPKQPDALYAYCGALVAALLRTPKADRAVAANHLAAYATKVWSNDAEFAVLTMRDFGRTAEYKEIYRELMVSKGWKEFTKAFGNLLE